MTDQPGAPSRDDETGEQPTSIRISDAGLKSDAVASKGATDAALSSRPPEAPRRSGPPIPPPPRSTSPGIGPPSAPPPPGAAAAVVVPPPSKVPSPDGSGEAVAIDLDDAEEVVESAAGRRVSLASLVHLAPVGRYGKFDLLGRIAYGGMAEIFLARELQEGRPGRFVVVKRVLPHVAGDKQFVDMFTDEARLVMQLSHPNICHVYTYGKEEGAPFISMEWVNGMPLSRVLRRAKTQGGLAVPIALKVVALVADALDHAHRAVDQSTNEPLGIVHRDVSPQNVMVSFDGVVKLLDFGIAKAASHSTRTEAGTIKGKFAYMAPEQCLGEPLDARADVFALGVVLVELLLGHNPYKKATEFDTMRALVYEQGPEPSQTIRTVSKELDAIVRKATAKRREERFQSGAELGLALEKELARMGEVVTTARIGERMNELFREEIKAGPRLDTRIQVPPKKEGTSDADVPRPSLPSNATEKVATLSSDEANAMLAVQARAASGPVPIAAPAPAPEPPRKSLVWVWLLAGVLLFGASGAALAIVLRPDPPPVAPIAPTVPVAPVVTPPVIPQPVVPAQTTGTLFVDSAPSGATITLGERGVVGTTPLELGLLTAGEWNVRLHLDGHEDWEDTVDLRAGERLRVFGELTTITRRPGGRDPGRDPGGARPEPEPAAEPGRLSLNTRPWSRVYVGSRLLGTTPLGDVEVPSGTVRLRLVDRDGIEHTRSVTVPAGGHAREFMDLSSDPSETP